MDVRSHHGVEQPLRPCRLLRNIKILFTFPEILEGFNEGEIGKERVSYR